MFVAAMNLCGVIDLIETDDVITEFKTSAQMMDSKEADQSLQLTIYSYAFEKLYQRPPRALKVIDFVKSKNLKLITLETRRAQANYQRLYGIASHVLKRISLKIYFPRTSFWRVGHDRSANHIHRFQGRGIADPHLKKIRQK